jgi:hypothetical protein
MKKMAKADRLIKKSIQQNRIVHADYSKVLEKSLMLRADDWVDNGIEIEFWGRDDDGENWRVHLDVT